MKPRIGLFLLSFFVAGCDPPRAALPGDPASPVRVVLLQHSYWGGGFDRPLFVAFADGTILFSRRYTRGITAEYGVVRMPPERFDETLGALGVTAALEQLDSLYDYAPGVTDQHSFYLLVARPSGTKLITVRAGLEDSVTLGHDVPAAFRTFHTRVMRYAPPDASVWTPDSVEVSIWPYEYAPDNPPLAWPAQWPGLTDTRWKRRPDEFVHEVRTLRLPFAEHARLDSLLAVQRTKQAVGISGKKWAMGYRWIFPHEQAWQQVAKRLEY